MQSRAVPWKTQFPEGRREHVFHRRTVPLTKKLAALLCCPTPEKPSHPEPPGLQTSKLPRPCWPGTPASTSSKLPMDSFKSLQKHHPRTLWDLSTRLTPLRCSTKGEDGCEARWTWTGWSDCHLVARAKVLAGAGRGSPLSAWKM